MAIAGLATILLVLVAIMSKRVSALVALIAIPVVMSLLLGFGLQTDDFILQGIVKIAPIAVMFIFAILFFGILHDAKFFDPIVGAVIKIIGTDPRKILPGTAILTACVHLDGSGASTFLIAIPALKPLYEKLQLDLRMLACVVAMAAGVCNLLPWGGPAIRAASALDMSVLDIYRPLIAVQLTGFCFVLLVAYYLGVKEYRRLKEVGFSENFLGETNTTNPVAEFNLVRFILNLGLTVAVVASMISGLVQPSVAFMLGLVLALVINFPNVENQNALVNSHAKTALMMASILFAAGVFNGILNGSGMLTAMAAGGADLLPDSLFAHLPLVVGLISMPLSLLFDPDSYYFGVLPVISGIGVEGGVPAIEVAQASLLGQMTMGFAVSPLTPATFLLVGLTGINLADHQRFSIPLLLLTSWVMLAASFVFGTL